METRCAKPLDSADYKLELFGILNEQGQFWSPHAFESEEAARLYMRRFWGADTERADRCDRTHSIVPVHTTIRLAKEPSA